MPAPVLPGAEPWSHHPDGATVGVLAVHGFTGSPSSMRSIAEAAAASGCAVELPRLPGHGTTIEEMLPTRWSDWAAEATAAHERLAARVERVVVAGQSMGGALALWGALRWPGVAGLVCINPVTRPQGPDVLEMLEELVADGMEIVPGGGSDIADPEASDVSYVDTPILPLVSFLTDGVTPITDRYGELTVPLRLFTSRQDHVVPPSDSEHLAATYGGPVDHTWLERSYHVATQDHDRHLVIAETVTFVERVAS